MREKITLLTIAGFDPSSGAGITSDIKTFEAHDLYGVAVCTAVTVQNDRSFTACNWVDRATIFAQIETLFEHSSISVVKIGIVQSWELLLQIIQLLRKLNPTVRIVLDPILKASSGYDFHPVKELNIVEEILNNITFITPNYEEIQALYPDKSIEDTISHLASSTNVYLKGGHNKIKKGWDAVFYNKIVQMNIPPKAITIFEKHGSGCVLSAALAANLAIEMPIEDACKQAKYYTEDFLNSSESLLGYHNYGLQ